MTSPLSICFRIANTSFCVQPAHPSLRLALPEPWAPFVTAPVDAPDACYTAEQASLPCDSSASSIYWGNDLWRISFPESGNTHLELANPNSGAWRTGAILSADFSSGVLFSDDAAIPPFDPIPFPLEHPLIIGRLSFLEGMVLHASCVRLKGRSFLFVGQSGRGKTTMARLWRSHGGEILNDERNIVRLMGEDVIAASSPWHGEENEVRPGCAPLAAILFIRHAKENTLEPAPASMAVARLLQHAFIPVFLPQGMENLAAHAARVIERTPVFDFGFTPNEEAIQAVLSACPEPCAAAPAAAGAAPLSSGR